jgi:predicted SAM-dependent methyltransferase
MYTLHDILRFLMFHLRRMVWPLTRPPLPQNNDGRVLLHIGCGALHDKRFINIDIQPYRTIHHLSDGKSLGLSPSTVDVIYASHVLEHFSHREIHAVLSEWYQVLKPLGQIFISVPDFSKLLSIYNEENNLESIRTFLMGSQGNPFDFHKNVFDRPSLTSLLEQIGFNDIQSWEETDYSEYPFDDYAHYEPTRALSLNLKVSKSAPESGESF